MSKKHMGSGIDDFLKGEGVFEEAQAQAVITRGRQTWGGGGEVGGGHNLAMPLARTPVRRGNEFSLHSSRHLCRQEQQQRIVRRGLEAETPVVRCRLLIDGIDEQANPAGLGADASRPCNGIDKQQFAEALALILPVERQSAQSHTGDAARQLLAPGSRQMTVFEFGQRQRVVAADTHRRFFADGDKALRQPLVLMLAGDLSQPVVQFLAAAVETLPVMASS